MRLGLCEQELRAGIVRVAPRGDCEPLRIKLDQPVSQSQADPIASVETVIGTPTRTYSRNAIRTPPAAAPSTTMMFATDRVWVRSPASVDAMASASQPVCGSGKPETSVRSSITAGTLLPTLQSAAVAGTNTASRCRFHAATG